MSKSIFFTVTTELTYDQRMIRICSSLASAGYDITLVGRKLKSSIPLSAQPFKQKRINCFFEKGKLFYAEYNIRLGLPRGEGGGFFEEVRHFREQAQRMPQLALPHNKNEPA